MKLNLFKRSMIFATFFGSCLCIALIVASLGTTHWVDARARILSYPKSEGRISFGLFEGHKMLNHSFGWRYHVFSSKLIILIMYIFFQLDAVYRRVGRRDLALVLGPRTQDLMLRHFVPIKHLRSPLSTEFQSHCVEFPHSTGVAKLVTRERKYMHMFR